MQLLVQSLNAFQRGAPYLSLISQIIGDYVRPHQRCAAGPVPVRLDDHGSGSTSTAFHPSSTQVRGIELAGLAVGDKDFP